MTYPMNDDTAVINAIPSGPDDDHDDLAKEIAKAAPKQWWNKGTIVLGAIVLLVGGFVGGLQVQKNFGTSSSATSGFPGGTGTGRNSQSRTGYGNTGAFPGGAGFPSGAAGGTGTGTGTGTGSGSSDTTSSSASATTGTVKLVDGSTIYVQTDGGDVITIKTDSKTAVKAASKSSLSSVKAGQSITVQGTEGTDGSVTATTVVTGSK